MIGGGLVGLPGMFVGGWREVCTVEGTRRRPHPRAAMAEDADHRQIFGMQARLTQATNPRMRVPTAVSLRRKPKVFLASHGAK